jgi:hypothetical protein
MAEANVIFEASTCTRDECFSSVSSCHDQRQDFAHMQVYTKNAPRWWGLYDARGPLCGFNCSQTLPTLMAACVCPARPAALITTPYVLDCSS